MSRKLTNEGVIGTLCNNYRVTRAEISERYHIPVRTLENWDAGKASPPSYVIELLKNAIQKDAKEERGKQSMNLIDDLFADVKAVRSADDVNGFLMEHTLYQIPPVDADETVSHIREMLSEDAELNERKTELITRYLKRRWAALPLTGEQLSICLSGLSNMPVEFRMGHEVSSRCKVSGNVVTIGSGAQVTAADLCSMLEEIGDAVPSWEWESEVRLLEVEIGKEQVVICVG